MSISWWFHYLTRRHELGLITLKWGGFFLPAWWFPRHLSPSLSVMYVFLPHSFLSLVHRNYLTLSHFRSFSTSPTFNFKLHTHVYPVSSFFLNQRNRILTITFFNPSICIILHDYEEWCKLKEWKMNFVSSILYLVSSNMPSALSSRFVYSNLIGYLHYRTPLHVLHMPHIPFLSTWAISPFLLISLPTSWTFPTHILPLLRIPTQHLHKHPTYHQGGTIS